VSEYKVIIPLDGSRLAEHALAFLPALSYFGQLHVKLISVVDFSEALLQSISEEQQETERNLLSTYLREITGDLEKHLGAVASYEVLSGSASTRIIEEAQKDPPDLLVISTHGRSGVARWQRGAVADKVIRGVDCPVLVVGPKAMEKGQWIEAGAVPPFKQILVPLDGSPLAEQALKPAQEFASLYASRLHLLQVLPYVPLAVGFVATPREAAEHAFDSGRHYIASVVSAKRLGEDVAQQVAMGSPPSEIEEYIKAHDIDLVVMTSHGRGGIARATLGSVTDRVIGSGPPVLVVRAS
jgi:nucleotide-binding universal stress UspA family protein